MSTPDLPLVWIPFDSSELGEVPSGLRYEVVDPTKDIPASVGDVRFYIPPYQLGPVGADVLPKMTSLEVVQLQTAGVDAFRGRVPDGVALCNGRGIHDTSTAELAVTLTLASLRGIPGYTRFQDRHEWHAGWRPALADKRVLIVGYGSIGKAIEARLLPFETEVVRVARTAREGVHAFTELPELLPTVDVVILVCPLTSETHHLVDADFLARMPRGALLVNVARGGVVDTDALVAACTAKHVSAAVDVVEVEPLPADSPVWDTPNLLITPHVGGASSAMRPRMMRLLREQLERFAAGEPLVNVMRGEY